MATFQMHPRNAERHEENCCDNLVELTVLLHDDEIEAILGDERVCHDGIHPYDTGMYEVQAVLWTHKQGS